MRPLLGVLACVTLTLGANAFACRVVCIAEDSDNELHLSYDDEAKSTYMLVVNDKIVMDNLICPPDETKRKEKESVAEATRRRLVNSCWRADKQHRKTPVLETRLVSESKIVRDDHSFKDQTKKYLKARYYDPKLKEYKEVSFDQDRKECVSDDEG